MLFIKDDLVLLFLKISLMLPYKQSLNFFVSTSEAQYYRLNVLFTERVKISFTYIKL